MFTDQNSKPIATEDKINLTLDIDWCVTYKMKYSSEPRDQIGKNIGKFVSKSLNGKDSQELLHHC